MDKKAFKDMAEFVSFCDRWRSELYTTADRSLAGLSMAGIPASEGRSLVLHFSSTGAEGKFIRSLQDRPVENDFRRAMQEAVVYTMVRNPQTADVISKPQMLAL